jgi:hypothetical protein
VDIQEASANNETVVPRKCIVEIKFPDVYKPYTYYNDKFNLEIGDRVFVDGKLEGIMGVVVNITYNFKIKLSDYKRVIGKADTNVHGEFNFAGSHFVSFDSNALTFGKVITWYKAPENEEEFVNGSDGSSFPLETLEGLKFDEYNLENGKEIYMENSVEYVELNDTKGRAIVVTSKPYIVEFTYKNGEISELYCKCYHLTPCKHCFATLFQLRETLKAIEENYSEQFKKSNYFATVFKPKFFNLAVNNKTTGSINL